LNRSGDSGHPCLVPDFRGNGFNFSPLSIMLAVTICRAQFPPTRKLGTVLQGTHSDLGLQLLQVALQGVEASWLSY
jgi:hypothetical protein